MRTQTKAGRVEIQGGAQHGGAGRWQKKSYRAGMRICLPLGGKHSYRCPKCNCRGIVFVPACHLPPSPCESTAAKKVSLLAWQNLLRHIKSDIGYCRRTCRSIFFLILRGMYYNVLDLDLPVQVGIPTAYIHVHVCTTPD